MFLDPAQPAQNKFSLTTNDFPSSRKRM